MPAFELGAALATGSKPEPYRRTLSDPVRRVLRVYTQDPGTPRGDGAIAEIALPWEPLDPGPSGCIFVVRDIHRPTGRTWAPVDLDSTRIAAERGVSPSTTEPGFAQQMTYAVAMATYERFRLALGRLPEFAPAVCRASPAGRLEIRPHWDADDNAFYDPAEAALCFGYVKSGGSSRGATQAGAYVFTALSHDVVVHETAHAILDGMRPHLMRPSNPDVAAFHEGLADLVALLMRFSYRDIVRKGLEESADHGLESALLTDLARQWGRTDRDGDAPLRRVLYRQGAVDEPVPVEDRYDRRKEHHDLGAVLVAAIFEAMGRVFRRKTSTIRKIAAQAPAMRDQVVELLTSEAKALAGQFLNIVIRAIDYCPPMDITFGEFLRALVTADWATVPDDPYHYREALVFAFRRYGITVPDVADLSEDALRWRAPRAALPEIALLAFAKLRHRIEPGWFASDDERLSRAKALGEYVTNGRHTHFGLAEPGRAGDTEFLPPVIESVRTLRRLTPDSELDFRLVAEVTQRVKRRRRTYMGGSTLILDPEGRIQFVIGKGVSRWERHKQTDVFLDGAPAAFRHAFEDGSTSSGPLVRSFHARRRRGRNA